MRLFAVLLHAVLCHRSIASKRLSFKHLSKILPLSETHLRGVLREYVAHYHVERNHQGLENMLIDRPNNRTTGRVVRSKRIGGMLSYYYRETA